MREPRRGRDGRPCAFADYTDLIVRQTVGSVFHVGGAASPDVIPAGHDVLDPRVLATDESYGSVPGTGLVGGGANNVYVRTRTPPGIEGDTLARLYAGVAPATAMLWPDRVTLVKTAAGEPYVQLQVGDGQIGVTPTPFVVPDTVDPAATLAAYVFTVAHRTTLPVLGNVNALRDWLERTPAFAQRATRPLPADATTYVDRSTYEHRGTDPVTMMFELGWSDVGPDTWTVALDGDRGIEVPPTSTGSGSSVSVTVTFDRPFTADLTWTVSGPRPAPEGARFRLLVSLVTDRELILLGGRELRRFPSPTRAPIPPSRVAAKAKESP